MNREDVLLRFSHVELSPRNQARVDSLRSKFQFLAATIDELCPDSREKSRCFNALDDALSLAIKAIARNT